jgi:hypothetical protein
MLNLIEACLALISKMIFHLALVIQQDYYCKLPNVYLHEKGKDIEQYACQNVQVKSSLIALNSTYRGI